LGNTIGHGTGRFAATGVGAIAGAAVGDNIETRGGQPMPVQNCTTQTTYENRTVGYNVQYEYAGKQYNVQMPYDPGPTIQLQVSPMSGAGPAPEGAPGTPGVVTAPPMVQSIGQPVAQVVAVPAPAYPGYYAPRYYAPYYYPPVGISLGFGFHSHRHWR
jgi:hypothetical protein